MRSSPGCRRRRGGHGARSTHRCNRRSHSGRSRTSARGLRRQIGLVGRVTRTRSAPGFAFGGDSGGPLDFKGGAPAELFRVYVATDEDCVNIVYRGAIVGSPAYAPRTSGPLKLPKDTDALALARGDTLEHGIEGDTLSLDGSDSQTNEEGAVTPATAASSTAPAAPATTAAAKVDLPDTAWPTGGYYWTVVPVVVEPKPTAAPPLPGASVPIQYRETELPQDACQSGRVMRFGKTTPPVVTSSSRPFASGLSPKGRLDLGRTHDSFVLRHAARCVAARPRRSGVRDPVEQVRQSVATARLVGDRGHVVAAPARARQLVLPRARLQPLVPQAPRRWRGRRRRH